MLLGLFLIFSFLAIILSRFVFHRWFNHISLYFVVWSGMIIFYELKLMNYIDLSTQFWMVVFGGSLSLFFGSLLFPFIKKVFQKDELYIVKPDPMYDLFFRNKRFLNTIILVCGIVGIAAALHHWYILINMYGSLIKVAINYNEMYRLRVENKIEGLIPYIYVASYIGVFFSGIKVGKDGKIGIVTLLPFLGVIIKELANGARAGILIALVMFVSVIFLSRFSIEKKSGTAAKSLFNKSTIITFIIIFGLVVGSAGLVRSLRGTFESYKGASSTLNTTLGGFFITPSLYLYMSAHVGVLTRHLEKEAYADTRFGEWTFFSAYNILAKFDLAKAPNVYEKGFFIPMWTNTSTVYRYLLDDFGLPGVFIPPFIVGFLTSFFWWKFYTFGRITDLLIVSFLFVGIGMSFLVLVNKISIWIICLISIYVLIKITEAVRGYSLRVFPQYREAGS